MLRLALITLLLLLNGCGSSDDSTGEACNPLPVPPEAQGVLGPQTDGSFLGHNGRAAGGLGESVVLDAVAQAVVSHPTQPWAYVTAYRGGRRIQVVDYERMELLQDLGNAGPQGEAVLSADGARLFVPRGMDRQVIAYDVGPDGRLTQAGSIDVGERVVALNASADGKTLWAGLFTEGRLVAIDLPSFTERTRIRISQGAWDIIELEGRHELYISDLAGENVAVVDTTTDTLITNIKMRSSPARMAHSTDESTVWVAVSGSDYVVAIDTSTRAIKQYGLVAEDDLVSAEGVPLPNSNPNAVTYEPTTNRVLVSRGADHAVTVFDGDTLAHLGSMPTSWWPTDVEVPRARPGRLLVAEGHGGGSDPQVGSKGEVSHYNNGTLKVIDLSRVDLQATTQRVKQNQRRADAVYPFDCPSGEFPIPTRDGQVSPIEHVILVVKENKTFDSHFGDLDLPGIDGDPELVRWTADINPNHRKLAREFNLADRFFLESQESDTGHLFLASGHLTEFAERFVSEPAGSFGVTWPIRDPSVPDLGNIFTHFMDHGVSIRIYGEIVGMLTRAADGRQPIQFSDSNYPGGPIINYATRDRDRATYVVEQARLNGLPQFTYMLLPDDHGEGTDVGKPTPESHVADNDDGLGILIDGLSHMEELWQKTAIFVLQDDPQGSGDHVSAARSFLIVASPWARRGGYISHHQSSYLSVQETIFRILGVPSIGRHQATAAPLWDLFTTRPDTTPYVRVPRTYPEEVNQASAVGSAASARMDFTSPDRNPDLGRLVGIYREWRMGKLSRAEAEQRLAGPVDTEEYEELVEESIEETTAWESSMRLYHEYLAERGQRLTKDGRVVRVDRAH